METFIRVGDGDFFSCSQLKEPIRVREDDRLTVRVLDIQTGDVPEIYLEDYKLPLVPEVSFVGDVCFHDTEESNYFKECFGFAFLRVDYFDNTVVVPFDVLIRKSNAKRAHDMLKYISSHNFNILKSCFSRSSWSVNMLPDDKTEPEALITQAENILNEFQSHKEEFLQNLRKRLVPKLVPAWNLSNTHGSIDPYDVINNISSLTHTSAGNGKVVLKGRHFDFNGADVLSLQPSNDVHENRMILGGFYSMRRRIQTLKKELSVFSLSVNNDFFGYESFKRLMLELTAQGMINRCEKVLFSCDQCIRVLERKYGIRFSGEIRPFITPFVRSSKIYRKIFTLFSYWYQLGAPNLDGVNFLMKLKSLSKLYEIFSMINLVQYFVGNGWKIEGAEPHRELGESVPSYLKLSKDDVALNLYYEKKIKPFDERLTQHLDLIDFHHVPEDYYPYWCPDFLIKLERRGSVKYFIFDAKYSSLSTVKKYSLHSIYEKYYTKTTAYDKNANVFINSNILCVMAIHAIPSKGLSYFSYWKDKGVYSKVPKLPMVGSIALTTDDAQGFSNVLDKIFYIGSKVNC